MYFNKNFDLNSHKSDLLSTSKIASTNFLDITYKEVLSFLEIIRPGGERLVDELLISEELSGKDLRGLASEYLSTLTNLDLLYDNRQSSLFDIMVPEFEKAITETELETEIKKKLLVTN